jgi:glycosyltransferase involved in cell wall biosynthesis
MNEKPLCKKMLVFHSAYTYDFLKKYGMEIFVQARDAGNFFEEILTVSPLATLQYPKDSNSYYSKPEFFVLDAKNRILEGRVGRYRFLSTFSVLNFFLAQFSLFFSIFRYGGLREIQLVRSEDPRLNGLYAYFFSKILRKPLVVGVWGNPGRLRELNQAPNMPRLFPTMKSEERLEKFVLRRADAVLAQNFENLQYALNAGISPSKGHYTQLGVGINKAHFLPRTQRKNVKDDLETIGALGALVLVCISRLEALKMVDHSIKACKFLKDAGIAFKLVLIGDGREIENLRSIAKDEGLADEVIFAGNRSQEWIAGAMNYAHINIAPLCGRSLLEASLGGLPAVAYDVDWHSEIVIPGATGFLIPNLNFAEMGRALVCLSNNETLRLEMANAMQSKAIDLASPEKIAQVQRGIYQKLVFSQE